MSFVYLDNAATSYPKPDGVAEAVLSATKEAGGNPGRSSHTLARRAADLVYDCREALAAHFGGKAERVVFTENATYALNLAITGLLPKGAHVLLSNIEHNATLRPVASLAREGVSYDFFSAEGHFEGDTESVLASLKSKLRHNTAAIIACHRSNILPIELPLEPIADFAGRHGLYLIVDASQSAGSTRIDVDKLGISALAAPAHKGLFGIRGCGFVLFGKHIEPSRLTPLIAGGSGSDSESLAMPNILPERLEAGTLPVEAIAALKAGVDFVERVGIDTVRQKEEYLAAYLRERLLGIRGIRLYYPRRTAGSTLLFNLADKSPSSVAAFLNGRGIALREGLHCAPLAHRLSGTLITGALRASFGYFNTREDADALVAALRDIARV